MTIKTLKTTNDGSKQMEFNGVEFWTNREGVIMYVPSGKWSVTDELVSAGLVKRDFYKNLHGHIQYTVKG